MVHYLAASLLFYYLVFRDKYIDHAKEMKNLWKMKVSVIPTVIGLQARFTKRLLQGLEDLEIRGRVDTTKSITLLR